MQRSSVIRDYEQQLYNRPQEETALRDGAQGKQLGLQKKYEEKHFTRLNKNKREKKMQRLLRAKNQQGEKVDDFKELNDIKHYFDESDQAGVNPKALPRKKVNNKKKVFRGRKLKKFRKK